MTGSPIFLVRHAATTLNASKIVQYPDTPLSTVGRWQATRLAEHLSGHGITHVASSDYLRARATAEALCKATGATLTVDRILRERHLGALRGRPYAEVHEQIFSDGHDPRDGESWDAFSRRVDDLWAWVTDLRRAIHGALAVVTHGLVCRALATRHFVVATDLPLTFGNASVAVVDPEPPWRVRALASSAYLDTTAQPLLRKEV